MLVNDVWGGEKLFEWDTPVWEHDLANGLRLVDLALKTHLITSHFALPLLIRNPGGLVVEMTDGTAEYNAATYRINAFYDLAKTAVIRLAFAQSQATSRRTAATAVALTPGWLRSEMMLEAFGVTEANWRDATERIPHFGISETPRYVGRAVAALAADPDSARHNGASLSSGGARAGVRLHRPRRQPARRWRYMVEVQDPGLPANPDPYRSSPRAPRRRGSPSAPPRAPCRARRRRGRTSPSPSSDSRSHSTSDGAPAGKRSSKSRRRL